jgi:hypothetical protein
LKRIFGSLLKVSGFITSVIGIAIILITGGYLLILGLVIIGIGVLVYFIDFLSNLISKRYYKKSQIVLFVCYLLFVTWCYMDWQKHTNIIFQNSSKNATGIIFGIDGYPELPKTFFWTKEIILPTNDVIITSTKEADMPIWVRYKFGNGNKVNDTTIKWNPNFTYNCIVNKKIIKAWIFTVGGSNDLPVQRKIGALSNQINAGKVNTIYRTNDNLLIKGKGDQYIDLQGDKLSILPDVVGELDISSIYLADNNFTTIPPQLY